MSTSLNISIHFRSLMKFTAPSMIMLLFLAIYSIVDGIFAARFVSTDALAAINIFYPFIGIFIAIGTMFGTGATAILSKRLGQKRPADARQILSFITGITFIVASIITAIGLYFLNDLMAVLGANEKLLPYCEAYALPQIIALPLIVIQTQFQYYFVAEGKPYLGMLSSLIGGSINIFLDYLFTVEFGWGIRGIAIASGLGYIVSAFFGVIFFALNKRGNLYFVWPKWQHHVLIKSITNGTSEMVSNISFSVTTIMYNWIMMHYLGEDGVAAISAILYLDFILISIALGYAAGVAPLISYNYGSHNPKRLHRINSLSCIFSVALGVCITILTFVFRRELVQLFVHIDGTVYPIAVTGLGIYAFSYLFKGLNVYFSAMFTAFSNGGVSAILSLGRTFVYLVALTLLFLWIWGIHGIWYAVPLAEGLALLTSLYFVKRYRARYEY